ncbi:MAG TPA: aldehyde dehydrogenase family protein, partial [Candidimonas sp.]|nr:aldehyde dehydrogenase family protein [Candidimonas sp.]
MASVQLLRCFIDGQWVETAQQFSNINPVNGQVFAQVCEADAATVQQAIQAANRASAGPWKSASAVERAAALCRIADGIEQRFDEFVQ